MYSFLLFFFPLYIQQGIDISSDTMAVQRVREAAEKAKIELSSSMQVIQIILVCCMCSVIWLKSLNRLTSIFHSWRWMRLVPSTWTCSSLAPSSRASSLNWCRELLLLVRRPSRMLMSAKVRSLMSFWSVEWPECPRYLRTQFQSKLSLGWH